MTGKARVIYWFRTDLRLHDSPALKAALDLDPAAFYPIWCWDPHYVFRARVGPNRWQFLIDCQNDVSNSITKLNSKSRLFVLREAPQSVLPKLFKAWKITHLVFEKDTDAYGRSRDDEVRKQAEDAGVKVIVKSGRTLWDSDELVKANGGKPTMSITQVQHAGEKIGAIAKPIPTPKSIPDPGDTPTDFDQDQPDPKPDFNSHLRPDGDKSYSAIAGPKGDFAPPTLEELGIKPSTGPHRGGETVALKALDEIIKNEHYTATFEKPKTAPTAFEPQSTTLLSPHLHFGSLSCREFYWRVHEVVEKNKKIASKAPASLIGQLEFRDMYFGAQAALGWSFAQTVGNDHCRFIPWHLRSKVDPKNKLITGEYHVDSEEAEEWFQRWKWGKTGFPWIDAIMRQLREEGWIHHLARHAVACFLTRGGCYVDWERGAEVFEEWLIDHETACNVGNWQWLSCTAFFSQFYRCYSPVAFPKKTDANGDFVRHYVPELKDYPAKYIYEPHKAPIQDQKKAGCLIKGDGSETGDDKMKVYPKPMFDFNQRREICISGMKQAYGVGLYGNNEKIQDGTWTELFPKDAEGLDGNLALTDDGEDKESADENAPEAVVEDEKGAEDKGGETFSGPHKSDHKRKRSGKLDDFVKSPKHKK